VAELGGRGNVRAIISAIQQAMLQIGIVPVAEPPWYYPSVGEYSTLLEGAGLEVTFATLFDRPTTLEGGSGGLRSWLAMFAEGMLSAAVPAERREELLQATEELARPHLFRDGCWMADYRRLRIVANRAG
jgi:trans-aconitate 2-methyltransferase